MPPIDAIDLKWSEQTFSGAPNQLGSNAFSPQLLLSSSTVSNIDYSGIGEVKLVHHRWERQYRFVAGRYTIDFVTSAGMRVYVKSSTDSQPIILPTLKGGSPANSWIDQGVTAYVAIFDTNALSIDTSNPITLIVEHYNIPGVWTAQLQDITLVSAYPTTPSPNAPTVPSGSNNSTQPTPLSETIRLSKALTERSYVQGMSTPPSNDVFIISNISPDITADISINAVPGVKLSPSTFRLTPQSTQKVFISFDLQSLESLRAGENDLNCIIRATVSGVTPVSASIFTTINNNSQTTVVSKQIIEMAPQPVILVSQSIEPLKSNSTIAVSTDSLKTIFNLLKETF